MPAAMESSQNIENPLEISIFSLNFFENVFFSWKSRKISPDLENLLRDLAGRAPDISACSRLSRTECSRTQVRSTFRILKESLKEILKDSKSLRIKDLILKENP